jgi:hypothetical protein
MRKQTVTSWLPFIPTERTLELNFGKSSGGRNEERNPGSGERSQLKLGYCQSVSVYFVCHSLPAAGNDATLTEILLEVRKSASNYVTSCKH